MFNIFRLLLISFQNFFYFDVTLKTFKCLKLREFKIVQKTLFQRKTRTRQKSFFWLSLMQGATFLFHIRQIGNDLNQL